MIAEQLAAARVTVATKSHEQIELETAAVWGARAVAAYEQYAATGDLRWRDLAVDFRHEAYEHAAGGPNGTVARTASEITQLTRGAL